MTVLHHCVDLLLLTAGKQVLFVDEQERHLVQCLQAGKDSPQADQ